MAITNHERVGKAMDLLRAGLGPFVQREFSNEFGPRAALPSAWQQTCFDDLVH